MGIRPHTPVTMPFKLLKGLLGLISNGLALAMLILLFNATQSGGRFFQGLWTMMTPPPSEPQVDIRSLIVQQIRGASELTTAIFGMEAMVPTSRDRKVAGYSVGKTTLLYIAYGEVRAGVDLNEITPADIQVEGDRIQVQLPPPKILDSKIDVSRSQVYDYDRGFLGLGPDVAPELQTLAQQETLEKVVEAACQQDILVEANTKAELAVTRLLNTAGYTRVTVETQVPSLSNCIPVTNPATTAQR
jgi:hypothetical protein